MRSLFLIILTLVSLLIVDCSDRDGRTLNEEDTNGDEHSDHLQFFNIPLTGIIDEGYSASIDIGTPPQTFNILIDTGSSNLAVAGVADYVSKVFEPKKSDSFRWLDDRISVRYSQGFWQGELARDSLKFSVLPTRPITAKFVVIDYSEYFFVNGTNWQGILGLGYKSIAEQDLEPFWETYIKKHNFHDIFSLGLCGLQSKSRVELNEAEEAQGVLTLGGVDPTKFIGEMKYTPIVKTSFFEVVISDIKVDHRSLAMDCKEYNFPRTIVDSGTTNLRLPQRVFDKVVAALKAYVVNSIVGDEDEFWHGREVVCWEPPDEKFFMFPTISVSLLDISSNLTHPKYFEVEIVPEQYLGPVIFTDASLSLDAKCYRFSIGPSVDGTILGSTLLEGFYVEFDRSRSRIGFAVSVCSRYASLNKPPSVSGVKTLAPSDVGSNYNPPMDLMDCQFKMYEPNERPILVAAYILICIACLCILPLLVTFVHGQYLECSESSATTHEKLTDDDEGDAVN